MNRILLCCSVLVFLVSVGHVQGNSLPDGSKDRPLRVMMVPSETGSSDVTQDYRPVFNAITDKYGSSSLV